MVHHVGSFEAKTRLAELLRLAERGDEVVVLRRGERVAVIVGSARYDEMTKPADVDWRQAAREWVENGPRVSGDDFRRIMADAKAGRP